MVMLVVVVAVAVVMMWLLMVVVMPVAHINQLVRPVDLMQVPILGGDLRLLVLVMVVLLLRDERA